MPAKKGRPTPTRKAAQTRQRERGEGLRSWLRDRAAVLLEAQTKRREERAEQLAEQDPPRDVDYVYEHVDRPMRPYVNPDRDRSLSGKARIRARKAARR
jgi:hypothetical protein